MILKNGKFLAWLFLIIGLNVLFAFDARAQTQTAVKEDVKKEDAAKVVTIPSDLQQTFQISQSEIEKAEAQVQAAQAALETAKARRDALVLKIQLFLKLPFDAKPQLSKEGLLQFLLSEKKE